MQGCAVIKIIGNPKALSGLESIIILLTSQVASDSCFDSLTEIIHCIMLWFNFILVFIFSLWFKVIIGHHHTQEQRALKIKPGIKLNNNRVHTCMRIH